MEAPGEAADGTTISRPSAESGAPAKSLVEPSVDGGTNSEDRPALPIGQDIADDEPSKLPRTTQRPPSSVRQARRRDRNSRSTRLSFEEASQPFTGVLAGSLTAEYAVWNEAVVLNALQTYSAGEDVFLAITPRILAGAWLDQEGVLLSPGEAVERFVAAVSSTYATRVLGHRAKLQTLRRCGGDGLPECAGFLALTVLAAYEMHADEGVAATAYYRRLDDLLRCGMSGGTPRGFDGDQFEGLWAFFAAWLRETHGRQLAMPGPDAGLRRFVALPLTHVPLRRVDIERLPDFFDWAGFEPGERVTADRLTRMLEQWARARGGFTVAGTDALGDERRAAVLAQIAHELESWDGSLIDATGGRTATVEVFLNWERRVPILSYLPRRPAQFPSIFDDGQHVLEAGQEGWYEPMPLISDDGAALRDGFSWGATMDGIRFVLRRPGADVIALSPSEFDGPVSHGSLVLGAPCAVMCTDDFVAEVAQHLEAITGRRCVPVNAASVPTGWRLFTGLNPSRRVEPPSGLEVLDIASSTDVVPRGGLRLGRRWAWLAGAPPALIATGVGQGNLVLLDNEPVEVDGNGVVQDGGRLSRSGVHVVQVGRTIRRLEIVDPEWSAASHISDRNERRVAHAAALPAGAWTVLGARPFDVAHASSGRWGHGALAACSFDPVWAVSFAGGPGASVMSLTDSPREPAALNRRVSRDSLQRAAAWANAIHGAQVRHPVLLSSGGDVDASLRPAWMVYVNASRAIRRALKAGRR